MEDGLGSSQAGSGCGCAFVEGEVVTCALSGVQQCQQGDTMYGWMCAVRQVAWCGFTVHVKAGQQTAV